MTTEKMTVHKALAELKLLDDRIMLAINGCSVCVANKHSNDKIYGLTIEDYKKDVKSKYNKAVDLIKRRKAIKNAVVLSNATTKIVINGAEYTVAEAIEMRQKGLNYEISLRDHMKKRLSGVKIQVEEENGENLEERADNYIAAIYGSKENNGNSDDIQKVRKAFLESNQYEIIDPLDVQKKIDNLDETISTFLTEVDAALSVSNALTEITIEY